MSCAYETGVVASLSICLLKRRYISNFECKIGTDAGIKLLLSKMAKKDKPKRYGVFKALCGTFMFSIALKCDQVSSSLNEINVGRQEQM